jgi:hypothetical protein
MLRAVLALLVITVIWLIATARADASVKIATGCTPAPGSFEVRV